MWQRNKNNITYETLGSTTNIGQYRGGNLEQLIEI